MRNIPLHHAAPRQTARQQRSARSQVGTSWSAHRPASSRLFGRRFTILAGCAALGFLTSGAAMTVFPPLYEAESRVLLADTAPQTSHPADLAQKVIAQLHLDRDPDFNKAPWQPPVILLQAQDWIEDQTGLRLPSLTPRPRGDLTERFWDRVDIGTLGRSSRVLDIRARARDPQQAAAIANAVARISAGGTLIAPALPPISPAFPSGLTLLLGGAGAGLAFGFLALGLFGTNPRQFNRAEDVETASGLPVVAVVPEIEDGAAALAHVLRDPGSPYTESLRKLYHKLHSERWTQAPKMIAITSALPGEGRSTLAASLGRLLASEGGRILLIDCDWRHPELHKLFRLSNDTGLTSLLVDPHIALDDVIHTDALSGLDIITAGRRNRSAVHKLISDPMRKVLASLASGYDLVLLDMPPVLAANETLLLSCVVDKLIFAVRWRHTLQRKATDAMEKVLGARGDIVGVVFTRVDLSRYNKFVTTK